MGLSPGPPSGHQRDQDWEGGKRKLSVPGAQDASKGIGCHFQAAQLCLSEERAGERVAGPLGSRPWRPSSTPHPQGFLEPREGRGLLRQVEGRKGGDAGLGGLLIPQGRPGFGLRSQTWTSGAIELLRGAMRAGGVWVGIWEGEVSELQTRNNRGSRVRG